MYWLITERNLEDAEYNCKEDSLTNVTELHTADFNLTIPPDTHKPNQMPGTWRAGGRGVGLSF